MPEDHHRGGVREQEIIELNRDVALQINWGLEILPTLEQLLSELSHPDQSVDLHRSLDLASLLALIAEMRLTADVLAKGDLSVAELAVRIHSMSTRIDPSDGGHAGVVRDALDALLSQIKRLQDSQRGN